MLYQQIIGQQEVKQKLQKMVNSQKVPHALLFAGKEGCGHLPMALAFAQHLFCSNKTLEGACGNCSSCNRITKLIHPDLHLVFPIYKNKDKGIEKSDDLLNDFRENFLANPYLSLNDWFGNINAENKQPIIPVDEAHEILRKLSYTSYEGAYKVVIIWQPEKMNAEAANKLLKILEEPPQQTIFVLVSSNTEQLLSTILSRVQQIQFNQCSDIEIENALVLNNKADVNLAKQIALLANGNYGEALYLIHSNNENDSFLSDFQMFMRLALSFDGTKALIWIDENATKGREKQKQFLQYALEVFRDCLMFNYGEKSLVRLAAQEKVFLEKFAPFVNQKNYEKLVEEFNNSYYYIGRNANPKILFMDLLLKTNELINIR